jgi:intracellular multiplication protein IcmP
MSQRNMLDDQPMISFGVLIAAVLFLFWVMWRLYEMEILAVLRYVRLLELYIINIISFGDYNGLIDIVKPAWLGGSSDPYNEIFTRAKFLATTDAIAKYIRWPAAAILFLWGVYSMFFSPRGKLKNEYSLEGLIKVQAKIWPIIQPIVNFNPGKSSARAAGDAVPTNLPLFAEALSPEEWLAYHNINLVNGLPEREAVRKALIAQLGPRWTGVENLQSYQRALFAAFAMKGAQKRVESDDLLGEIALCWSAESGFKISLAVAKKVDSILADPDIGGKAIAVAQNFAYRTTALLGVLRWGRSMGGVLAPAAFIWLRGEDRALWYPLNNLGRRSYHSEAAGAMAHFMAELAAKKPLPIPRVETALITINQYLANNQVQIPARVTGEKRKSGAA